MPTEKDEKYDIEVPHRWTVDRVLWMLAAVVAIIAVVLFVLI